MKQKLSWLNRERLNALALFMVLLVSYAYTFPRWADPNQNSRLDMVVAVVDEGTFQIDNYVKNTVDYAKVGDHYYSDKAPGAAFLGIPVYAALKVVLDLPVMDRLTDQLANSSAFQSTLRSEGSGVLKDKVRFALAQVAITFVVAVLPSALLGLLMYLLLAKFTGHARLRLGLALVYGLLTPAFAYATAFYGHQLSAALLFGAFYLVFMTESTPSIRSLLLVGLLLGYSVVTEYPSLLMVGILYLYTFYRLYRLSQWKRMGWVTLAGGMVAAGWMLYNRTVFGGWLSLGYSNSELWTAQHHTGFMSLTLPTLDAMLGITFGLFRGLFILSPILLMAFPGFWLWWKSGEHRPEFVVAVASTLSIYLFNSSSIMWWGGFSIGPRYLLPALPFLTLPVIFVGREWLNRTWMRVLISVLSLWSLVATWGLTLAEQAFPSDAIRNPLVEYALPNWMAGNIARNLGTILGFKGVSSLLPLLLVTLGIVAVSWRLNRSQQAAPPFETIPSPGWRPADPPVRLLIPPMNLTKLLGARWSGWLQTARQPHNMEVALAAMGLALLLGVYFWRAIVLGEVLLPSDMLFGFPFFREAAPAGFQQPANSLLSDMVLKFYPWHTVVRESLQAGQFPMWNPYIFAGTPLFANAESAILYPLNLIGYLVPQSTSYALSAWLRMWVAGLGMFLFARAVNVGRLGAALAAVTFMFSGSMVVWLNYPVGNSYAWMPLLFYAGERVIATRRPVFGALVSGVIAIQIFGGHYQTVFIILLAWSLYSIYRVWSCWQAERGRRAVISRLGLIGGAVVVGFLLATVQLLPFVEWLRQTNEVQYRVAKNTLLWVHPEFPPSLVVALGTLVMPNLFGNPAWGSALSFFYSNYIEEMVYVGIAPLLLAGLAVWDARANGRPQRGLTLMVAGLGLVFLGMALRVPGLDLLNYLPVFNVVAVQRYRLVFTFCAALLAGVGIERLLRASPGVALFHRGPRLLVALALVGAVALGVIRWALIQFQDRLLMYGRVQALYPIMVWAFNPLNVSMSFPLLVTLAIAGWLTLYRQGRLSPLAVRGGVLALVVADLFFFGAGFNPSLPPAQVFPLVGAAHFLQGRFSALGEPARMVAMNDDLPPNTGTPYGFSEIAGSDYPTARYVALARAMGADLYGTNRIVFPRLQPQLLDLLNVRYIIAQDYPVGLPIGKLREVYADGSIRIFENPDALPRAFVVHQVIIVPDEQLMLAQLTAPAFDPRRQVVLAELLSMTIQATAVNSSRAVIEEYQPQYVRIRATANADGVLVLSDADYPGWSAWVDGQPAKIYRANYAFRAVALPHGEHVVEFRYMTTGLSTWLALTAMALVVIVAGCMWDWKLAKR